MEPLIEGPFPAFSAVKIFIPSDIFKPELSPQHKTKVKFPPNDAVYHKMFLFECYILNSVSTVGSVDQRVIPASAMT